MAGRRFRRGEGGGSAFAVRLVVSFAAALVLVGLVGYFFMDRQLRASQVERFADAQRSDALAFESFGAGSKSHAQTFFRIQQVLDAASHRAGTIETLLIGPDRLVHASGNAATVGTRDTDVRIEAALRSGQSYAAREGDVNRNHSNFEFVTPVNLPDGRYALEISYDEGAIFDAQLADLRRGLLLVGLLALLGGGGVFYLFGGRVLMRSHRAALQRATRDGLTDLPNQRAFQDEFPLAAAAATRDNDPLALVALDIDDFKFINDRNGHPHGDAILKRVAAVLREGRPGDRAFRVGGDEFALLLPHTDADGVRVLAKRLLRSLDKAALEVTIGVSASRPGHPSDLLRAEADAALYEAKRQGGHQIAHFDDIRDQVAVIGADKRAVVRRLIDEGRLTTAYQPIWDISKGTLLGVEALARPDADYGLSGPAEAFDVAEQMGRVHDLDVLCVKSALAGAPDLPEGALLFVNLCPRTLDLDADENDWLRRRRRARGVQCPERVVIEITERFGGRAAVDREMPTAPALAGLQDRGRRRRHRQLRPRHAQPGEGRVRQARPLDRGRRRDRPGCRAMLMAIATYARQTGAFVIAEGIEDDETLEFLHGIDELELPP